MEPDPVADDIEVTEYTIRRYVGAGDIRVTVRYCEPGSSTTGPRDRPFWNVAHKGQESTRWIQLPVTDDGGVEARGVAHRWANLLEAEARARKDLFEAERAVSRFMSAERDKGQKRLELKLDRVAEVAEERRRAEDDRLNTPG